MTKEISLVILIETKPGCAHEQIQAFKNLQPLVLAEKGCLDMNFTWWLPMRTVQVSELSQL